MKFVKFFGGTEYVGEEFETVWIYPDNVREEWLDLEALERAMDNTEKYEGTHSFCELREQDYNTKEEYQEALCKAERNYLNSIWGNWVEITEEEFLEAGGQLIDY